MNEKKKIGCASGAVRKIDWVCFYFKKVVQFGIVDEVFAKGQRDEDESVLPTKHDDFLIIIKVMKNILETRCIKNLVFKYLVRKTGLS